MGQMIHIRKSVFGITQGEMAELAGVSQATVSRWETGDVEPGRAELQRIRAEARRRDIAWNDAWFFETAPQPETGAAA